MINVNPNLFCDGVDNPNGGTCSKGAPGSSCIINEQCKHGICEDGACRYPNQGVWDDDPNKWRWENNNPDKICKDGWEKEIYHSQR